MFLLLVEGAERRDFLFASARLLFTVKTLEGSGLGAIGKIAYSAKMQGNRQPCLLQAQPLKQLPKRVASIAWYSPNCLEEEFSETAGRDVGSGGTKRNYKQALGISVL